MKKILTSLSLLLHAFPHSPGVVIGLKLKIFLLVLIAVCWGYGCTLVPFKTLITGERIAHIYVDPSSTSVVFQMVDLMRQPKSEPKYVAWRRYLHPMPDKLLTEYNISRAGIYNYTNGSNFAEVIRKEVYEFYKQHKNYKFIVHTNLAHPSWTFDAVAAVIPRNKIKKVYLYEDSIGRFLWDTEDLWQRNKHITSKYDVVFRVSFKNEMLKKYPQFKDYSLEEMNFNTLRHKLSQSEKATLFQLCNFDPEKIKKLVSHQDFIVFIDDPLISHDTTFQYIDNLLKQKPELKKMVWLYKQHPRETTEGDSYRLLKKRIDKVYPLYAKTPLEVLIIADFNPKYIGNGSSFFFSLTKEQILGYVEREKDTSKRTVDLYIPSLQKLNIIDDSNTVFLLNKKKEEKE